MQGHFNSYRQSVMEDSLEGFPTFAAKSKTCQGINYSDELKNTVHVIQNAVRSNKYEDYKTSLRKHQKLTLELFLLMTNDLTPDRIFSLGLKWVKFSRLIQIYDKFYWIPRYTEELISAYPDKPQFNTSEMQKIFSRRPSKNACNKMLDFKRRSKLPTIIMDINEDETFCVKPLRRVNEDLVYDWTQELFDEG